MIGKVSLPSFDGDGCDEATLVMLYAMVRYIRPALVIEAGTYRGAAACTTALAMKDGGIDGEIWTADVKGYDAEDIIRSNGMQDIVNLYRGDFVDMLNGPLLGRKARFAFIDSGKTVQLHGEEEDAGTPSNIRMTHLQAALKTLQIGGVVAVDDASGEWDHVDWVRANAGVYIPNHRGLALFTRKA